MVPLTCLREAPVLTDLAALAVQALIQEAELTPKPGLVDRRGSGAHADLDLERMLRSARSLEPCFAAIARASRGRVPDAELREELAAIGREGEHAMYEATGGSNSHKGAIWALGLLVAGSELCAGPCRPYAIAQMAGRLARLPDSNALQPSANGARARMTYGVDGATGQAQAGFPHVMKVGLPALWLARSSGIGESFARLDTLMAIMAELDDTCLLHRGGTAALQTARTGAARVLEAGGTSARVGMQRLLQLDAHLLALNASPGGSADLLAATLFLDSATDPSIYPFHHPSFGDSEPWKS